MIGGALGIVISAVISDLKFRRAGIPASRKARMATAGTGIVPIWVSCLNLASWGAMMIGILMLLVRLFW